MHELGIIFHVIETIEELGKENSLTSVSTVTLEVGEVSGVVPQFLTECWTWAVEKSELMKDSQLIIETNPAVTFCESCQQTYPTMKYAKICPHCGSEKTYLLKGSEMSIKQIEAM